MKTNHALKEKARALEPTIRIGKAGLSDSIIKEIIDQLKRTRLVKIKMLKSCMERKDKKQLAQDIAEKTESEIVDRVGFVVVLKRR